MRGSPGPSTRLTIGLTGGIGSGKSTVASELVACGAVLIDTDAISRSLTAPGGGALPALTAEFGDTAIGADGGLDRERMRALAFSDPRAKARLEAVLHPMIGERTAAQAATAGHRTVVFDVPLLTESAHWRSRVDRIVVVDCSESTQVQRVRQRNGWAEDAVRRVIALQASRAARRAIADAVIWNDGLTLAQLHAEVHALWSLWHA